MSATPDAPAMTFEIRFGRDPDPEDVVVTSAGVASVDGLAAMARAGLSRPYYRPGMRILVDHRALDWRGMSADDVRLRADRILTEEAALLAGSRLAVVSSGPADFGVLRMLWAHADPGVAFEVEIFSSLEEARTWLAGPAR